MSKGTKPQVVRAIGYVRVSTEQQSVEGVSLDAQKIKLAHTAPRRTFIMITSPPSDGEWGLISVLKSAPSPVVPSLSTAG
jgi:hypothetical protein